MIKKSKLFFIASIIIFSQIGFTSAEPVFNDIHITVERALDTIIEFMAPFFEKIIGEYSGSEFFFLKVLILFLLIFIIGKILESLPLFDEWKNNKKVIWIISIIISILAVRFIKETELFTAIFIQYGALGASITAILPMVIFFYFIHNTKVGTFGRKIFWIIYASVVIGLWISKQSEISEVANWAYIITLIAIVLCIFFDKSIHSYFGLSDLKVFMKRENKEAIRRARRRIVELREDMEKRVIEHKDYLREVREEERKIRELSKGDY